MLKRAIQTSRWPAGEQATVSMQESKIIEIFLDTPGSFQKNTRKIWNRRVTINSDNFHWCNRPIKKRCCCVMPPGRFVPGRLPFDHVVRHPMGFPGFIIKYFLVDPGVEQQHYDSSQGGYIHVLLTPLLQRLQLCWVRALVESDLLHQPGFFTRFFVLNLCADF